MFNYVIKMNQLLFLLLLIKKEICHFIKLVSTFAFWKQCVFDDKSIYIDMHVQLGLHRQFTGNCKKHYIQELDSAKSIATVQAGSVIVER